MGGADIDIVLTLIFLLDFVYRLRTAPSKSGYPRHGGVFDFLGCVPGFRIFRVFRIVPRLNYERTTQRKPMWLVVESTVSPWRAAGR